MSRICADRARAFSPDEATGQSLHPDIARKVLLELSQPSGQTRPRTVAPLTTRGRDVLPLVARGLSNQDIAPQLAPGESTVRTRVRSILGNLQLASRTQAALYALREGHATLEDARLPD